MLEDLGGVTSQLVKLALDASVMRHNVTANNIANANTPGFKPQKLEFEQYLTLEAQKTSATDALLKQQIDYLRPQLESGSFIVPSGDDKVQLDMEMKELAQNTIRYQALLSGLSKRSSIIAMAISGQGGK